MQTWFHWESLMEGRQPPGTARRRVQEGKSTPRENGWRSNLGTASPPASLLADEKVPLSSARFALSRVVILQRDGVPPFFPNSPACMENTCLDRLAAQVPTKLPRVHGEHESFKLRSPLFPQTPPRAWRTQKDHMRFQQHAPTSPACMENTSIGAVPAPGAAQTPPRAWRTPFREKQ